MAKINYDNYTHSQLVAELKKLSKRKKYGLVWEEEKTKEKFEAEAEGKLPVLVEDKKRAIKSKDSEKPTHILIEGDNYHALSVLNYTHSKSIDVIYIDPPFNTGAKDWRYNNAFVEKDDPYKHSKWLSMMSKRIILAKKLLKKDGALICAIDDYELNPLGLLLEEIFSGYEIDLIIVEHHPQGAGSDTISRTHEYAYVITSKDVGLKGRVGRDGDSNWSLKRSGQGENNWRRNRPKQFYAIIVDKEARKVIDVGPELERDDNTFPKGSYRDSNTKKELIRIYPFDKSGKERCWRYNRKSMLKLIKQNKIQYTAKGSLVVKKKNVSAVPVFSIWRGTRYNAGTYGSGILTEIMGEANTFPYPKSIYTIYDMLSMIVGNNPNAIVLDFFAGSGTTGHAVLELNKEDEGERQFILCSNNENNICKDVTYVRTQRVIEGYEFIGKHKEILFEKKITPSVVNSFEELKIKIDSVILENKILYDLIDQKIEDNSLIIYGIKEIKGTKEGLGGNLKYYKTNFVGSEPTHRNKKLLTDKSIEMLCIRENTFEEVLGKKDISIYKNQDKYTAILFDEMKMEGFKRELKKLKLPVSVYVFSLEGDDFSEDFDDLKNDISLCSIPEAILKVYRRIYKTAKPKR